MVFEDFVIPAVDLKNGRCVQLVQGNPQNEIVSLPDPLHVALSWVEQGARVLHVIDLDGALWGSSANTSIIASIIEECDVDVQVGGGVRTIEHASELLELGAARVIVGTAAFESPQFLDALVHEWGGDSVMVALDARGGKVCTHGWTRCTETRVEEAGLWAQRAGAGSILFTNIDTEGLLRGVSTEPVRRLAGTVSIPVVASGGVSTLDDLMQLNKAGAAAAVVGSALYTGRLSLRGAMAALENQHE
ncbi:1-(5-phosphoribosyl)-5-[(5-phosphoribosylamino)methylideneamino]imidazole-4-carboxamide isomerase [Methermicoccus shengliensis]|uniref:1-(5-phosphoribosyl)-5-[(5-phosphoribosylamino)methylideneamino] imidazole-4-carboxamide isomerase n=1 Tax=Methermicoccus shengliensis TaxID=660064 RepID=A0A832RXW5_9EURY|nr:1-(5-phosphoribosyl)-5-[(5-phosphoribosylamino)methylideneamino]imidazole-4-carboxamide isomerase [Methermicoccus shengliensis]HIH69972.1 1-(5-phosphoribosyl)-5-[(5-phosphoribosylamino)methylideneamino]imidazole-4-carboxamide isomerase [Methermicoccus shengliensis]